MNVRLSDEALEAAAVAAETWDVEKHGECRLNWYHEGYVDDDFDAEDTCYNAEHG